MYYRFLCCAAVCGPAVCCSSFAGEIPGEPLITVSPHRWSTQSVRRGNPSKERQLDLELKVTMKAAEDSGWKIACCGVGESGLKLVDSEGSSCPGMECYYYDPPSVLKGLERGKTITLSTKSWLPSATATWMEVRGKIPFFICRASFMSESVSLKMGEGNSVPLVLRNAGPDGKDVNAVLKVVPYKVLGSEGWVSLHLLAPSRIGFLGVNMESEAGAVLPVDGPSECISGEADHPGRKYCWIVNFREEDMKGEEWKVSVNYADELKKIVVPVQARFGLFGVMENRNIQQEGNGDENARHDK